MTSSIRKHKCLLRKLVSAFIFDEGSQDDHNDVAAAAVMMMIIIIKKGRNSPTNSPRILETTVTLLDSTVMNNIYFNNY